MNMNSISLKNKLVIFKESLGIHNHKYKVDKDKVQLLMRHTLFNRYHSNKKGTQGMN